MKWADLTGLLTVVFGSATSAWGLHRALNVDRRTATLGVTAESRAGDDQAFRHVNTLLDQSQENENLAREDARGEREMARIDRQEFREALRACEARYNEVCQELAAYRRRFGPIDG